MANSSSCVRSRPNRNPDVEETESVQELRDRLKQMESIMHDRRTQRRSGIDDTFLSAVFGVILVVIASVALYAFYNLFKAVHRRWFPYHEL